MAQWWWRQKTNSKGKNVWYYRGEVPERDEKTGEIRYRRIERSSGTSSRTKAEQKARLTEQEFYERASRGASPTKGVTFAEAALTYMQTGGEREPLIKILPEIGNLELEDVTQPVVAALGEKLYPDLKASSLNRKLYTPIIAVMHLAATSSLCPPPMLTRPKGHADVPPLNIPAEEWFDKILPKLAPSKRALVIFLTLHGRRIQEALDRTPKDVCTKRWTLLIPDSKTGVPVLVRLAQPVIDALQEYDWRAQKWLFGTRHRSNVARDIGVAAKKAGIDSYGSHALGRHSFATRLLNDGKSLEFVRKAGHWKTIKMVSERYGHLEQDDVSDAVRDHGAKWGAERAPIKTEGAAKKPKLVGK